MASEADSKPNKTGPEKMRIDSSAASEGVPTTMQEIDSGKLAMAKTDYGAGGRETQGMPIKFTLVAAARVHVTSLGL